MKSILYILHSCPYPPNKGDRIRSYNIIKYLSKIYDVKILYPCFSESDVEKRENLLKYCSYVECIRMNRIKAILNCIIGFFRKNSMTRSYFNSEKIENSISSIDFDAVLVDCSSMAQYFMDKNTVKIIDFIDIDSEKWRLYSEESRFLKRYIYRREYIKLKRYEEKILEKFDKCIVVSEQEKSVISGYRNVEIVKNGIDFGFFRKVECNNIYNCEYIIFSGAMNYFPNIDSVIYFCNEIFPLIKGRIENVKFIIAGMNPHRKVKKLESEDIIVTGFVEDIREFISNASVCVVPLRIARGIQNKILEAMSIGVPVVSTSVANKGINAINRRDIFISDDPEEFADLTIELMNNKLLSDQIVKNANLFVRKNFNWDENLKKLNEVISLAAQKPSFDSQDYVGCQ